MFARILCVDDDSHINELNHFVLTRAGYDVATAESPSDALKRLKTEAFDLVITDLFPQSPSDAFVTTLRGLNPSMLVILVTGNHNPPPEVLQQVDSFVFKAYSPSGLTDSVREVLTRPKLRRIG
jgi:DNA-binding NtrC family response regulator